jgi:hypothetical protein
VKYATTTRASAPSWTPNWLMAPKKKKFVKVIVACPHRLPKLPESTLRKQARPNNGSLFCSHCGLYGVRCRTSNVLSTFIEATAVFYVRGLAPLHMRARREIKKMTF